MNSRTRALFIYLIKKFKNKTMLLLKSTEKYNQDSVSIVQDTLLAQMEQDRVTFFSYVLFVNRTR